VVLVVVVVVVVLLEHNIRVDKLEHKMMDMGPHKPLVISYLFHVEYQRSKRQ